MGCLPVLLVLAAGRLIYVVGTPVPGNNSERKRRSPPVDTCPGAIMVGGHGVVSIVPTGWGSTDGAVPVNVTGGQLIQHFGARAYFADTCTAGRYDHKEYATLKLLGKTFHYTTDVSGAHCGCNVAMYLVSMHQNSHPSECNDYYCDANKVCGVRCAEIDLQEANEHSWHSTLHTANDNGGKGCGFGGGGPNWHGPRDWEPGQFGLGGSCIDTGGPFQVAISFPKNAEGILDSMQVTLTQQGRTCSLFTQVFGYEGNGELTAALQAGMTPVFSYWRSDDMMWLDGKGDDGQGFCKSDLELDVGPCGETTRFYNFSVTDLGAPAIPIPSTDVSVPTTKNTQQTPTKEEPSASGAAQPWQSASAATQPTTSAAKETPLAERTPADVERVVECPGNLRVSDLGDISLVPAGWNTPSGRVRVDVQSSHVAPHMGGRAYFADRCRNGHYWHEDYLAMNLLGKTLRYSVDLSGVGCGCNAALSLVSMKQNTKSSECSDFYCDANSVCGEACAEINIQEANQNAWHSTLHSPQDHVGLAGGFGGGNRQEQGPRHWSWEKYRPAGTCIDTFQPFQVAASFLVDPLGNFATLEVNLTQKRIVGPCTLSFRIGGGVGGYAGVPDLTRALQAGMTPVVSYWSSTDMQWLDGPGSDNRGACIAESPQQCKDAVIFSDFSVEIILNPVVVVTTHTTTTTTPTTTLTTTITEAPKRCPGRVTVESGGSQSRSLAVSLIPAAQGWPWNSSSDPALIDVEPSGGQSSTLIAQMGGRAYFAETCTAGIYDPRQYTAWNLLGRTLRFSVDLSDVDCGCNAAFYLVSMRQNPQRGKCSDYYCDANKVCGESCAEIDIMEANAHAWHSTLHTGTDRPGVAKGVGGPQHDWTGEQYGPAGVCVNTSRPFDVAVSFRTDSSNRLRAMDIHLSQRGSFCPLELHIDNYAGMAELSDAMLAGMTPVISYWSSKNMLWLDGVGASSKGLCAQDRPSTCSNSVRFHGFAVENLPHGHATLVQMQQSGMPVNKPVEERKPTRKVEKQAMALPGCSAAWEQCGGLGFTGSFCCQTGCFCQFQNAGYSQCKPEVEGQYMCGGGNRDLFVQRYVSQTAQAASDTNADLTVGRMARFAVAATIGTIAAFVFLATFIRLTPVSHNILNGALNFAIRAWTRRWGTGRGREQRGYSPLPVQPRENALRRASIWNSDGAV